MGVEFGEFWKFQLRAICLFSCAPSPKLTVNICLLLVLFWYPCVMYVIGTTFPSHSPTFSFTLTIMSLYIYHWEENIVLAIKTIGKAKVLSELSGIKMIPSLFNLQYFQFSLPELSEDSFWKFYIYRQWNDNSGNRRAGVLLPWVWMVSWLWSIL